MNAKDVLPVVAGAISNPLVAILLKAGAPILADLVKDQSPVAGKIVQTIAEQLGVPPTTEAIVEAHTAGPEITEETMRLVQSDSPAFWAYLVEADKIRAGIFAQEASEPWFSWAWRPAWMWLLAAFWTLTILSVLVHLPTIDLGTLMTLTAAFMALYMGGHAAQDIVGKLWGKPSE